MRGLVRVRAQYMYERASHACTCMHTHVSHVCMHMYACIHVQVCIGHACMCIGTHMQAWGCACACVCVLVCVCVRAPCGVAVSRTMHRGSWHPAPVQDTPSLLVHDSVHVCTCVHARACSTPSIKYFIHTGSAVSVADSSASGCSHKPYAACLC